MYIASDVVGRGALLLVATLLLGVWGVKKVGPLKRTAQAGRLKKEGSQSRAFCCCLMFRKLKKGKSIMGPT